MNFIGILAVQSEEEKQSILFSYGEVHNQSLSFYKTVHHNTAVSTINKAN